MPENVQNTFFSPKTQLIFNFGFESRKTEHGVGSETSRLCGNRTEPAVNRTEPGCWTTSGNESGWTGLNRTGLTEPDRSGTVHCWQLTVWPRVVDCWPCMNSNRVNSTRVFNLWTESGSNARNTRNLLRGLRTSDWGDSGGVGFVSSQAFTIWAQKNFPSSFPVLCMSNRTRTESNNWVCILGHPLHSSDTTCSAKRYLIRHTQTTHT